MVEARAVAVPPLNSRSVQSEKSYTHKQGQYLAFIYYYTKVNGRAPSEADMQKYFGVTPPSVHQMVVTLKRRLDPAVPGQGRSVRLLVPRGGCRTWSNDAIEMRRSLHWRRSASSAFLAERRYLARCVWRITDFRHKSVIRHTQGRVSCL